MGNSGESARSECPRRRSISILENTSPEIQYASTPDGHRRWLFIGNLPRLVSETKTDVVFYTCAAMVLAAGFFLFTHRFWIPATPGPDQNGYLVGGKNFARSFSTGFVPQNPQEFVGREWIEARGRYFPKYPLGLSVLFAIMLKIGGAKSGVTAAFMVNPVAMSLSLLAIFLLARLLVGSFFGLLAAVLVATSPVCIGLTNTPSSHATAICVVSCGFYLLIRWWQDNGLARALGAGLLLGSAVTIRYTEGMLLLPLLLVALLNLRRQSAWLIASWAVPVVILAIYNWFSMHHLTGYDTTNESTGFSWEKFQENWEIMLRELYNTGLFFTLPFAVLGGFLMFRWNWRVSLVLVAWAAPNLLLYTSYYWAPDGPNIGYLRFVLTIFPALSIATVYFLKWILARAEDSRILAAVALSVLIAVGCGVNLNTALAASQTEASTDRALLAGTQTVLQHIPAGSTIFGVDQQLNFLQLAGDYHLYDVEQFDARKVALYADIDPTAVTSGLQPQRAMEIYDRVKGLSQPLMSRELIRQQNELMTDALTSGRQVFFVLPASRRGEVNRLLPKTSFVSTVVTSWDDPGDFKSAAKPHWLGITHTPVPADVRRAVEWQILEVKAAPPPKLKTSKPVKKNLE